MTVLEQRANLQGGKISEYLVDLDIAFQIDNIPNLIPTADEQDSL